MTDKQLLAEVAVVLAGEVSEWTIRNIDCYPRVAMWKKLIVYLGVDYQEITQRILKDHRLLTSASIFTKQALAPLLTVPAVKEPRHA